MVAVIDEIETISFAGGPLAGQTMRWRGGDVLEQPIALDDVRAPVAGHAPPERAEIKRFYYRRSMVTRSVFVFQP